MMRAYPGCVSLRELSPDTRVGLWLNIPALDANDDLRAVLSSSSALGGNGGHEYIEFLQDVAWMDEPEIRSEGKRMLDIAMAKQARVKK